MPHYGGGCVELRPDGSTCGRMSFIFDPRRGGMLCREHALAPLERVLGSRPDLEERAELILRFLSLPTHQRREVLENLSAVERREFIDAAQAYQLEAPHPPDVLPQTLAAETLTLDADVADVLERLTGTDADSATPTDAPPAAERSEPPGAAPSEPPASAPGEPPGAAPSEPPASAPGEPPGAAPSEPPASAPGEPSAGAPGETNTAPADGPGDAPPQRGEPRAVSWEAVLSTYLPAMLFALGVGIALPAIPTLARSFDIGFGTASYVITAFLIGGTVGSLPTGWLIDRVGRRPIMIAGPLLTAGIALLVMTAQTFPELLIYRFLDGWAAQMWLLARLAGISHGAATGQRGRQVSWMYAMDNVGRLSGPLLGGVLATTLGPRSPFAAYAVLSLVALVPTVLLTPELASRQPRPRAGGEVAPTRVSLREIILPRLPFFGVAFFSAVARGPIFNDMLHLYAAFAYNLSAANIGLLATVASTLSLPIGIAAGWLMDRLGRKATMVPGFAGVTLTMLLLALTAFLQLPLGWYVAVFLAAVAAQSLTGGSIQTVGADVAPPNARGMFLGLWRFTGQIGTSVSPVVFAFLADSAGYGTSFVFVALAALVTAGLLVTLIPETGKPRVRPATS